MIIPLSKDNTTEMNRLGLATYDLANDRFLRVGTIDTLRATRRGDGTCEVYLVCRGQDIAGFTLTLPEAAQLANVALDLVEELGDVMLDKVLFKLADPADARRDEVRKRLGDLVPEFD